MRWLFVTGCNNTFTTLMKNSLAHHPDIDSVRGEGQVSKYMPEPSMWRKGRVWAAYPRVLKEMRRPTMRADRGGLQALKDDWMKEYDWAKYMMEKSPPNSVRMPWLKSNFREISRNPFFIVLHKNPYAICEGIVRRRGGDVTMEIAAKHTKMVHEIIMGDLGKHIDHSEYMIIPYQGFVVNPQAWFDTICKILIIPKFTPPNIESIDKDRVEKSLARLTTEDIDVINKYWTEAYETLGYKKIQEFDPTDYIV